MSRDHAKFRAFHEADALAIETYRMTRGMPDTERYGLQGQLRRAAVSAACNIVEGSTRSSLTDYCRFLEIARGSSRECAYLLRLSHRLDLLSPEAISIAVRYEGLSAGLFAAIARLRTGPYQDHQ